VIEPTTAKEALKYMTFQTFNVIVVNENFDMGKDGVNYVLQYLSGLPMSVRRQIFVVLISPTFATMDYMNTLNKSVNLIINIEEISEMGLILKKKWKRTNTFITFSEICSGSWEGFKLPSFYPLHVSAFPPDQPAPFFHRPKTG